MFSERNSFELRDFSRWPSATTLEMNKQAPPQDALRLGEYIYDLNRKTLLDENGVVVPLRAQSNDALAELARRPGEIVARDDLIAAIWPDLHVTDDSLSQCIADIRRALGDNERRLVQTFSKRGYRLATQAAPIHISVPSSAIMAISHSAKSAAFDLRLKAEISATEGQITDISGACIQVRFDNVHDALGFAFQVQESTELSTTGGPCIGIDAEYFGQSGNLSKQLIQQSLPGEVRISGNLRDLLVDDLDCNFIDLGEQARPDDRGSMRVFLAKPAGAAHRVRPILSPEDLLPTIAVIPFQARGLSEELQVMSVVLSDDVISILSRSRNLNVISRLSTSAFRERSRGLAGIGEVLGAQYVLSGALKAAGSGLALDLELSEIKSERIIWSDRLSFSNAADLSDIEAINEIVTQVLRAVFVREALAARHAPLPSLNLHTALLGAVALMHRLSQTDFYRARQLLEYLISEAPHLPTPLAWMARWHVLRVAQGWSDDPQLEARMALSCTGAALDIDPENVLALVNEGLVLTNLSRRLSEASERYDAALEISPNDAIGRLLRGTLNAFQGDGEAATKDTERALHLAPLDPFRFFFLSLAATASVAAGDNARALELATSSMRMNRVHTSTLRVKAVAQMRLGREDDARQTVKELLELQPDLRTSLWLKSAPSGNYDVGRKFAETLRAAGVPE